MLLLLLPMADAHDHAVDGIPDGAATSPDPIDSTLWAHIFVNLLAFGVLFPLGMVLGVSHPSFPSSLLYLTAVILSLT